MPHPTPVITPNVNMYNPYAGIDRGLARLRGTDKLFRVRKATWINYGFNTAPGYLEFQLETFDQFPGESTLLPGPGMDNTYNCVTRDICDNPIMIENYALWIYNHHYLEGGELLTLEEMQPMSQIGAAQVQSSGKGFNIMTCESRLVFQSPDGEYPIACATAEITYTAIFERPDPNASQPRASLEEHTFTVPWQYYRPYQNVVDHIKTIRGAA